MEIMDYKTTWVIVTAPFGYSNVRELIVNGENETQYRVAFGCTNEWVDKNSCYVSKDLAEARLNELKTERT